MLYHFLYPLVEYHSIFNVFRYVTFLVGERGRAIGDGAARKGLDTRKIHCCRDHAEAQAVLRSHLRRGRWVFLKASRGMGLEKLLEGL